MKINNCPICHKSITMKPSQYKKLKGLSCCSKKCRSEWLRTEYAGSNNPNYRYQHPIQLFFSNKYMDIRNNAKKRKLKFNLDRTDLYEIFKKQNGKCYYTNIDMKVISNGESFSGRDQPDLDVVSVDRIDSSKGYFKNNIVLCCNSINKAKGSASFNEFKKFLQLIKDSNETIKG